MEWLGEGSVGLGGLETGNSGTGIVLIRVHGGKVEWGRAGKGRVG